VSVIYDHPTDTEDGVERRRITYSVREFPGTEEIDYELLDSDTTRYRLYKKNDVLGRDGTILATEESGAEQVLADFVEDLQFYNVNSGGMVYVIDGDIYDQIRKYDATTGDLISTISAPGKSRKSEIEINDGIIYISSDLPTNSVVKFNSRTEIEITPPIIVDRSVSSFSVMDTEIYNGILYVLDADSFKIRKYNLETGYEVFPSVNIVETWGKHDFEIHDRVLYLSGRGSEEIKRYDIMTGSEITPSIPIPSSGLRSSTRTEIEIHNGVLYSMEGGDWRVRKYNITTGSEITPPIILPWSERGYPHIEFSGERLYLTSYGDRAINIFDINTGDFIGGFVVEGSSGSMYGDFEVYIEESGKKSLVNIKLTLRSKSKRYPENKTYTKAIDEEHHIGNYNFEFNDKYKRDVFFSTVAVRNMLL
jgi:hypothetical protein